MKKIDFMKMLPAVGLLLFAASCSDDVDDVRIDEKEAPALNASFSADLEGKIWQDVNWEQTMWMTNDGKLVDASAMPDDICGANYSNAYYFADGKVTVFQRQTSGPAVYPLAHRRTYTYTADLQTGVITYSRADGSPITGGKLPFEIEKLTSNELVIHDGAYCDEVTGFKYRRCVLTPVPEAEAQQWWDEYVDMDK